MKLLVADDHALFRDAFLQFIHALRPQWAVTACHNFQDAYDHITDENGEYDLVMLDLNMPGMNGLQGLDALQKQYPNLKTSILSGIAEDHHIKQAMTIGASAYFPKTLPGKTFINAIEQVINGEVFLPLNETGDQIMPSYYADITLGKSAPPPSGATAIDPNKYIPRIEALTPREKEVLGYLCQGFTNQNIADTLGLKLATVKLHVGGVCRKMGADNRTHAAIIAHQCGYIPPTSH